MAKPRRRAVIIGFVLLAIFGPGLFDVIRLSIRQHQLDKQLAKLKADQERLLALEQRLHTDPAYVEGLIRSTFKLAKPGEFVISVDNATR